jgi:hypothetical protein
LNEKEHSEEDIETNSNEDISEESDIQGRKIVDATYYPKKMYMPKTNLKEKVTQIYQPK